MSQKLDEIKAPIAPVMEEFERKFRESMKSPVPLLDRITHYIVKRKGKQMRPMFVFLSAGLHGPVGDMANTFSLVIRVRVLLFRSYKYNAVFGSSIYFCHSFVGFTNFV